MSSSDLHVILHIGPHKTGTTYIQQLALDLQEPLQSRGVNYPSEGIGPQFGHHHIAKQLQAGETTDLRAAIHNNRCATMLFSTENFDRLTLAEVKLLRSGLPTNARISVAYFLRSAHEVLISNWQQKVRMGLEQPWSEYLVEHTLNPYKSPLLNHDLVIQPYAEVFGHQNIHLFDFNWLVSQKKDLFYFLMDYFGITGLPTTTNAGVVKNKSMLYQNAEFNRMLATLVRQRLGVSGIRPQALDRELKQSAGYIKCKKHLTELISWHMTRVNMEDMAFVADLSKYLTSKLAGCTYATPQAPARGALYNLPSSSWMLSADARAAIESIFEIVAAWHSQKTRGRAKEST